MKITFREEKGCRIITVEGRVDFTDAQELRERFSTAGDESNRIIVDLKGLEYVSSSGLRAFLLLIKKIDKKGGELIFTGLSGEISQLLDITGIREFMKIMPDTEAALAG